MSHRILGLTLLFMTAIACAATGTPMQIATPSGVIEGTLLMPAARSKVPVALLIAGSGPTDRDGNGPTAAARNDSLKLIAAGLADAGIASLRYDKRGIGASASAARREADLRFEDYVQDAAMWVEALAKDERFTGVTIVGHSEGSLIGMIAAQRTPAKAFVSMAGTAEPAATVLRRQLAGRLPADLAPVNESILTALEAGTLVPDVPAQLAFLYRPSVQPYLVSWFRYDPVKEIAQLRVPCLVAQGDTDIQVRVADAEAMHAAQSRCELAIVPGMNHVLKTVPDDRARQVASYGDPTLPIAPGLMQALVRFITADVTQAVPACDDRRGSPTSGSHEGVPASAPSPCRTSTP